jgi:hypothetical protein
VAPGDLTLADTLVGEVLFFFNAYEKSERGELTLEEVDKRIDMLGVAIQGLDVARSNPDSWPEYLSAETSSYDHLWPAEQVDLFLRANYAALHASIRKDLGLPVISLESIAREVLLLKVDPSRGDERGSARALSLAPLRVRRQGPSDDCGSLTRCPRPHSKRPPRQTPFRRTPAAAPVPG